MARKRQKRAKARQPRQANKRTADPVHELVNVYLPPHLKGGAEAQWKGVAQRITNYFSPQDAHRFLAAILNAVRLHTRWYEAHGFYEEKNGRLVPVDPSRVVREAYARERREFRQIQEWSKRNRMLAALLTLPQAQAWLQRRVPRRGRAGAPQNAFLRNLWRGVGQRPHGLIYSIPAPHRWSLLRGVCECFSGPLEAKSIQLQFRRFDKAAVRIEQGPDRPLRLQNPAENRA